MRLSGLGWSVAYTEAWEIHIQEEHPLFLITRCVVLITFVVMAVLIIMTPMIIGIGMLSGKV